MTLSHQQPIGELQEAVGVASIKHRVWGNFTVAEDTVNYSTNPPPHPLPLPMTTPLPTPDTYVSESRMNITKP